MDLKLGKGLYEKYSSKIESFEFEVGVLEDKPHYQPVEHGIFEEPKLKEYAGGQVRQTSKIKSELSTAEILVKNMERLGINILKDPFERNESDIIKFTHTFLKMALDARMNQQRVVNLIQAIVRNPILKLEYGKNKASTADAKGFDRHLFDTGQMFKAIKAKVKRVRK